MAVDLPMKKSIVGKGDMPKNGDLQNDGFVEMVVEIKIKNKKRKKIANLEKLVNPMMLRSTEVTNS